MEHKPNMDIEQNNSSNPRNKRKWGRVINITEEVVGNNPKQGDTSGHVKKIERWIFPEVEGKEDTEPTTKGTNDEIIRNTSLASTNTEKPI